MSRLFAGTPFDQPPTCKICGKTPNNCRCLALPEKTRMSQKAGPRDTQRNRLDSGLVLTPKNSVPPPDQVARIGTEKRKGNRVVTVISGLDHPANDLPALCAHLKQQFGAGGSVKDRTIELQGDHANAVGEILTRRGMRIRLLKQAARGGNKNPPPP